MARGLLAYYSGFMADSDDRRAFDEERLGSGVGVGGICRSWNLRSESGNGGEKEETFIQWWRRTPKSRWVKGFFLRYAAGVNHLGAWLGEKNEFGFCFLWIEED